MDNSNELMAPGVKFTDELRKEHSRWVTDQVAGLAVAFGIELKADRLDVYVQQLIDIPKEQLRLAFWRSSRELKFFPKIAELRELAGVTGDGRPGPEESWARMPKGDRMEEDTIVWCQEESLAYGAARPLLLEGDPIAARMCYLERYRQEVINSRNSGRKPQWTVSAGYDKNHRLATIVTAVKQGRLSLRHAKEFIPWDLVSEFQLSVAGPVKTQLAGETPKALPGWGGLLQQLMMESHLPELTAEKPSDPEPLTVEQIEERKTLLKEQAQRLKRDS